MYSGELYVQKSNALIQIRLFSGTSIIAFSNNLYIFFFLCTEANLLEAIVSFKFSIVYLLAELI